jgi:hypothetical protein
VSDDLRRQEVLEQLEALGIGFGQSETSSSGAPYVLELRPETDDELEPYGSVAPEWEVDWYKAAGCALIVAVSAGMWALILWTIARVLRG